MINTYSWSAWHELNGKSVNPDGKNDIVLSGETEIEKVMELFYLDQMNYHISKHYDTVEEHCGSIEKHMRVKTLCI